MAGGMIESIRKEAERWVRGNTSSNSISRATAIDIVAKVILRERFTTAEIDALKQEGN